MQDVANHAAWEPRIGFSRVTSWARSLPFFLFLPSTLPPFLPAHPTASGGGFFAALRAANSTRVPKICPHESPPPLRPRSRTPRSIAHPPSNELFSEIAIRIKFQTFSLEDGFTTCTLTARATVATEDGVATVAGLAAVATVAGLATVAVVAGVAPVAEVARVTTVAMAWYGCYSSDCSGPSFLQLWSLWSLWSQRSLS